MPPPHSRIAATALVGTLALGLAACAGDEDQGAPSPDLEPDVSVTGTDALKFEPDTLTASAGEVAIELTSGPGVVHNVAIEGEVVVEVPRGQTGVGTIELEAGEYTFWCDVPGHRRAGMEGRLTVE